MMLFSLKIKQMNKFPDYLFQLSKDYDTIEEICIEGLAIERLKCEAIANQEIVEEAEWFYILDSYPIRDKETEDIIFQKFSMKTNFKLKYPVANPFSI